MAVVKESRQRILKAHRDTPTMTTLTTTVGHHLPHALASGVIALILEANANLTWRDVQHILVHSARVNDANDNGWGVNGAGHDVSHKYGFGAVDAGSSGSAENWTNVDPAINITSGTHNEFSDSG